MSRARLLLVCLTVLAIAAPSSANARRIGAFDRPAAQGMYSRDDLRQPPAKVEMERKAKEGTLTFDEAMTLWHRALTDPTERGGAGFVGSSPVGGSHAATDRYSIGSARLNSDELDDVFVIEISYETNDSRIFALDGATGSEIWSTDQGGAYAKFVEADGDPGVEIAVLDVASRGRVVGGFVAFAGVIPFTQTLRILDGASGAVLQSKTFEGRVVLAGGGFLAGAFVLSYGNFVADAGVTDDVSGDRRRDLYVTTIDYNLALVYAVVGVFAAVDRAQIEFFDAVTGAPGPSQAFYGTGSSWVLLPGDVDGDGRGDVIRIRSAGPASWLEAVSADGKTKHWSISSVEGWISLMDADGVEPLDVLADSWNQVRVVSGQGAALWERQIDGFCLWLPGGTIDSAAGIDLLELCDAFPAVGVQVTALSGATGDVLQGPTAVTADEPASWDAAFFGFACCAADYDADGAGDVLFTAAFYSCPDWCVEVSSQGILASGKTGTRLWEHEDTDSSDGIGLLLPLNEYGSADVDGDGVDDAMVLVERRGAGDAYEGLVETRSGATGSAIETTSIVRSGGWGSSFLGQASPLHLAADPGRELLVDFVDFNTGVEVLAYDASTLLWRR